MDNKRLKKGKHNAFNASEDGGRFEFTCPRCAHPILFQTSEISTTVTKLKRFHSNTHDTYFSLRRTFYQQKLSKSKKRKRKCVQIDIGSYFIKHEDDVPRWNAAFKKLKRNMKEDWCPWDLDTYGMLPETKDELMNHWYRKGDTEKIIYSYYAHCTLPPIERFEKFVDCEECMGMMVASNWYLDVGFGSCTCSL